MKKEILMCMKSTYRDDFKIEGYLFGSGEPSVCIVGPMRGDEVQQQYVCAQLVHELQAIEAAGCICPDKSIMVIPSCNPFSMNVGRRFWAMDGTDINRMFPGYNEGETTQRIADAIFQRIQGYKYGIQLASFYVPGEFIPHMRMLRTGYEDVEDARLFGMPYVTVRQPLPFDTTLLNYNWQIWNTSAFSPTMDGRSKRCVPLSRASSSSPTIDPSSYKTPCSIASSANRLTYELYLITI